MPRYRLIATSVAARTTVIGYGSSSGGPTGSERIGAAEPVVHPLVGGLGTLHDVGRVRIGCRQAQPGQHHAAFVYAGAANGGLLLGLELADCVMGGGTVTVILTTPAGRNTAGAPIPQIATSVPSFSTSSAVTRNGPSSNQAAARSLVTTMVPAASPGPP